MRQRLFITLILCFLCFSAAAQNVAVKTNLLGDAALSPEVGIETALAPRWTFELLGRYNPWDRNDDRKWKHWKAQAELRFWPCQSFNGWFIGTHAQGGAYNLGNLPFLLRDESRYEGWFVGAGVGLGYQWILSRHLNLEVEAGGGYNYTRYDRFRCGTCGQQLEEDRPYHFWGPTKASFSLLYVF